jgi:hypothetical protein
LVLSALFAIAYSQSPLYTSNQNQYFLQGLAAGGYGYLSQDWLANTIDSTPVFSKLVELTYRLLHQTSTFYVYYALLMGIYLFSLIGIANRMLDLRASRLKNLTFTALLIVVHSAGLRFALSRWIGTNWTYVLEDGVADQRMLGPVFQPSAFGVFLALSLYLYLLRKPYWACCPLWLPSSPHLPAQCGCLRQHVDQVGGENLSSPSSTAYSPWFGFRRLQRLHVFRRLLTRSDCPRARDSGQLSHSPPCPGEPVVRRHRAGQAGPGRHSDHPGFSIGAFASRSRSRAIRPAAWMGIAVNLADGKYAHTGADSDPQQRPGAALPLAHLGPGCAGIHYPAVGLPCTAIGRLA